MSKKNDDDINVESLSVGTTIVTIVFAVTLSIFGTKFMYSDRIAELESQVINQPKIAVLDFFSAAGSLSDDFTEADVASQTHRIMKKAQELQKNGYIVIRSEAAIAYPKSSVITLDSTDSENH